MSYETTEHKTQPRQTNVDTDDKGGFLFAIGTQLLVDKLRLMKTDIMVYKYRPVVVQLTLSSRSHDVPHTNGKLFIEGPLQSVTFTS